MTLGEQERCTSWAVYVADRSEPIYVIAPLDASFTSLAEAGIQGALERELRTGVRTGLVQQDEQRIRETAAGWEVRKIERSVSAVLHPAFASR